MDILRGRLCSLLARARGEAEEAVRVCVDNAAPAKEIDLLKLYDKLYNTEVSPRIKHCPGWCDADA